MGWSTEGRGRGAVRSMAPSSAALAAAERPRAMVRVARAVETLTASALNYNLSYLFGFITPVALAWLSLQYPVPRAAVVLGFCAGAFGFSFVEYALHRWAFHAPRGFVAAVHRAHHLAPREPIALPFPTATAGAFVLWWLLAPVIGRPFAYAFSSGLAAAYFCYGVLHDIEHSVRHQSLPWSWLQRRWALHAAHHRHDRTNFGVTTSLWDRVFGTHREQRRG